jgi:hypothetical protein
MRLRCLGRAVTVAAAALSCTIAVAITSVVAEQPAQAASTARPTILSPGAGGSVAGRFTGPYTVDMTGAPSGEWWSYVQCYRGDYGYEDYVGQFDLGSFTWDGTTNPVRTFTSSPIPNNPEVEPIRCNWSIHHIPYTAYDDQTRADVEFTVQSPPDPQVVAPTAGAIVQNGFTGPFTVDLSKAMPGTYGSQISCSGTQSDYAPSLPDITWDGATSPLRTFRLTQPMPTAPNCYWNLYRTTQDDANPVYNNVVFSVDAPPVRISSVTQSPATFYPLVHDGYRDTTTTSFHLSRSAIVTARVLNSSGRTVVTRAVSYQPLAAGARSWAWNGRDNDGRRVAAGTYRIRLTGEDSTAHVATVTSTATLATRLVSRTATGTVVGPEGTRGASSGCSAARDDSAMELDCWGGTYARARYLFTVPASTYATSFKVRGYAPTADICCDGRISKTSSRLSKTTLDVTAQVTGWRAYNVEQVTATWTYKKRI